MQPETRVIIGSILLIVLAALIFRLPGRMFAPCLLFGVSSVWIVTFFNYMLSHPPSLPPILPEFKFHVQLVGLTTDLAEHTSQFHLCVTDGEVPAANYVVQVDGLTLTNPAVQVHLRPDTDDHTPSFGWKVKF